MKFYPRGTVVAAVLALAAILPAAAPLRAQEWARQRLEQSKLPHETIRLPRGGRDLQCFVTRPATASKPTTVIVVHELFGLSHWVRSFTDELAGAGYLAIAPDLLSGTAPNGGGTADLKTAEAIRKSILGLTSDRVLGDLTAVVDHARRNPAGNGRVVVVGLGWGGAAALDLAQTNQDVKAVVVFYAPLPSDPAAVARMQCPVFGQFADGDPNATRTVEPARDAFRKAGRPLTAVIHEGAGHGFMRAAQAPRATPENIRARDAAWKQLGEVLKKY